MYGTDTKSVSAGSSPIAFMPRPEPHGMRWVDLSAPLQPAVKKLLRILADIATAPRQPGETNEQNNNLLISGNRGSGKTTVLMTARYAIEKPEKFFDGVNEKTEEDLRLTVGQLKHQIVWLDVLNLEPLPANANLLATLLVRIRGALEDAGPDSRRSSILEESADDCWNKIDKLVREAAFFWDETRTADPHINADIDIRCAEIFARFRVELAQTIEAVCKTLTMSRFGQHIVEHTVLLLPIDNIDRTSKHLYSIVKLAQIVSSQNLWLLLAADTSDFQLFLERAFKQELTGGPAASENSSGEDEMPRVARRQAAAAARKLLPPSHHVEIVPSLFEGALDFRPDRQGMQGSTLLPKIKELLEGVSLFRLTGKNTASSLYDLIDLSGWHPKEDKNEGCPRLTEAGYHALDLTARQLLDLWQYLREISEISEDKTSENQSKEIPGVTQGADYKNLEDYAERQNARAIHLAARMLNSVAAESILPTWAYDLMAESELLGRRILQSHGHQDDRKITSEPRLSLELTNNPIRRRFMRRPLEVIEGLTGATQSVEYHLSSHIVLNHLHGIFLKLVDPNEQDPNQAREIHLPAVVEGWLMLLFDLVACQREPSFINMELDQSDVNPRLAATRHRAVLQDGRVLTLEMFWPVPRWPTFIHSEILARRLEESNRDLLSQFTNQEPDLRLRYLFSAWIRNICAVAKGLLKPPVDLDPASWHLDTVESLEESILAEASELYKSCEPGKSCYDPKTKVARSDVIWRKAILRWLEEDLPLFLMPESLPVSSKLSSQLIAAINGKAIGTPLYQSWHKNREYLASLRRAHVCESIQKAAVSQRLQQAEADAKDESGAKRLRDLCDSWFEAAKAWWPEVPPELQPKPFASELKADRGTKVAST